MSVLLGIQLILCTALHSTAQQYRLDIGCLRLNGVLYDRAQSVDGELIQMEGYAYVVDDSEPGKLKVHLDGVPVDSPYWVLALGDEDGVSRRNQRIVLHVNKFVPLHSCRCSAKIG